MTRHELTEEDAPTGEAPARSEAPSPPRRGWRPLRAPRLARPAAETLCALAGPVGAGKTTLLDSLDQPDDLACSTSRRKILVAPGGSRRAEALLSIERLRGRRRPRTCRLRVIETGLDAPPAEAEAMLLLLPADGLEDARARRPLLELASALADRATRSPRRLAICFTKLERLHRKAGRDALWRAARREQAAEMLAWSFGEDGPYGFLRSALSAAASRRRVWLQPISSFGFVAGNGGANVSPDGAVRRTAWLDELKEARSAGERDWRPFLTHDALLLAAEGRVGAFGFPWRRLIG